MNDAEKLRYAVGYMGLHLRDLPMFILWYEKCEGREISQEDARTRARGVHEYIDNLMQREMKTMRRDEDTEKRDKDDDEKQQPPAQPQGDPENPPQPPTDPGNVPTPGRTNG
jgi:hypothetical protein